jgi:hypothetical protein
VSAPRAWRMVLLLGRAEAARLAASPAVVLSFAVAAALIWWNNRSAVLLWWSSDITIGTAFLIPAAVVLLVTQEAAGRPRRDGLEPLYDSYPVPAAVRTGGLLLGVAGPLALAAGVAAGAVIWLNSRSALGAPQPAVLAGAILLVALAGAAGVALGTWVPRPAAGLVTVLVLGAVEADLVLSYDGWVRPPGGAGWLFPWYQPGSVPGALAGISLPFPWLAHAAELAALTGLAVAAALWPGIQRHGRPAPARRPGLRRPAVRRRAGIGRGAVGVLAAACVAAVGWTGWLQTSPIPAAEVSTLVAQTVHPARFEQCEARGFARYCFFPAFRPLVGTWATPVSRILSLLPAPPSRPLVVRQVTGNAYQLLNTPPDGLVNPASDPLAEAALRAFDDQTGGQGPRATLRFSPSDPPVMQMSQGYYAGDTVPASGLLDTTGLAISTAYWAVGLPTTAPVLRVAGQNGFTFSPVPCEPLGQAREAIAIWLAASARPGLVVAELGGPLAVRVGGRWISAGLGGAQVVRVSGRWILTYYLAGTAASAIPQATAPGAALARAMLRLPAGRVKAALAARWPGWLSPAATDAQLAAALGISMPKTPAVPRSLIRYARNDGIVNSRVCT